VLAGQAADAEEPHGQLAAAPDDVAEIAHQGPRRAPQRAAGQHDGDAGVAEQLGRPQPVGDHDEAAPPAQLGGQVVAGGAAVQRDRGAVGHQCGRGPCDRRLRLRAVAQPHLEGALVGAVGRHGASAHAREQVPAFEHLEILADGHGGDVEAAHEVGHAHPAVDVEQAQHLLLPLVFRDAHHAASRVTCGED
jgi:hypothetical protein